MNKGIRIQKIQEIQDQGQHIGQIEILWKDALVSYPVYKVPLEYLIYNKYNGRILSRAKSLEKQNQLLDPETDEGKKLIEKLLYESNPDRNKRTEEDITRYGQQKVGIITKDGIIIDGNRRAMLLNRSNKYNYFKAVVLPVTLEEDPLEVERLETTYQMGEDEKLGYNATEKYIKSKELYLKLTGFSQINYDDFEKTTRGKKAIEEIAKWMGEAESEIKKYLSTMVLMDDYLEYLEYDGIYTQLDKREDQFLSLQKWLKTFYGEDSARAFDGYKNSDVDTLKSIAFDYLRCNFEGKRFRTLAEGNSDKHFFGDKNIWTSFKNGHFEIIRTLPKESPIDYNSTNLEAHLNDRDKKFFESAVNKKGENQFLENFAEHEERLLYNKAADEPEKLIKKAVQSFDSIKTGHKAFSRPEVQNQVLELGEKVFGSLQKKSPGRILNHIISLLEKFDVENVSDSEKEAVERKLKKIQQLGYNINKKL